MKLRTEELVKVYRGRRVVNGISLEVSQGEVVGLLGPNGAGKTTTFYMIVGLVRPQSGHVYLDTREITRLPMYRRAREGIAYLPQEPSVFRNLTVEENLLLVLEAQPLPKAQRRQRAEELMQQLNIAHLRRSPGRLLSGGERRRVEIARALATKPKFILLDEPFTGVDPLAIEDIGTIVHNLAKSEHRIGILITDHNVEAMLDITERAYIIADGVKRAEGPAHTLLQDPVAIRSYFGERYTYGRGPSHRPSLRAAAEAELRQSGIGWSPPEAQTIPPEQKEKD